MKRIRFNHSVMLDGSRVGTELNSSQVEVGSTGMSLDENEVRSVENAMNAMNADRIGIEKQLKFEKNKSKMLLAYRVDARDKEKRYLNLSGNTLTFLTGENVVGNPNPIEQLRESWSICLKRLEKGSRIKMPESLWNRVKNDEFMIHSLEFAGYTSKLENPDEILNILHGVFHLTYRHDAKKGFRSLANRLRCQWVDSEYEDSFRLKVYEGPEEGMGQPRLLYMFGMYDKSEEVLSRQVSLPETHSAFIKDRLRVDLAFQFRWFEKNQIRTARDLQNYVEKVHEGSWVSFLRVELNTVLKRTCVREILSMDGGSTANQLKADEEFIKTGDFTLRAPLAKDILFARVLMTMSEEDRDTFLFGGDLSSLIGMAKRVKALKESSSLGIFYKRIDNAS